MTNQIRKRILEQIGDPELIDKLDSLSPTDLQSLMLEVYGRRAGKRTPRQVGDQYGRNRFVRPARASPEDFLEFDRLAFSLLPDGFEGVELSPVAPLGSVSCLAPVHQNNILTTARNTDVCSDATNVLALECAARRKGLLKKDSKSIQPIRLAASHRLTRAQRFDEPGAYPHFRVFSLVTAGRDRGAYRFETDALCEQVEFYLSLMTRLSGSGSRLNSRRTCFIIVDPAIDEFLPSRVLDGLNKKHPGVRFEKEEWRDASFTYYSCIRFQIFARDQAGTDFLLVDGGFTDWTRKLMGNHKERLLVSGIGSERILDCFREEPGR